MPRKQKTGLFLNSEHIGVSGERYCGDDIRTLLATHAGGRLEYRCTAVLRREITNERDPHAVEVLVHGVRVGYIAKATSDVVASKIGDREVDLKCVIHWNGEMPIGIYHVKLFPIF